LINVGLRTRVCGGHVVVALIGELDTTDAIVTATAVAALAPGGERLIIDLEALEFIDCHAVRELLGVRHAARQGGGDVLLAGPHGAVLRLLTMLDVPGVHASAATAAGSVPAPAPSLLAGGQQAGAQVPRTDDGSAAASHLVPPGYGCGAAGPRAAGRQAARMTERRSEVVWGLVIVAVLLHDEPGLRPEAAEVRCPVRDALPTCRRCRPRAGIVLV
jgi:anti-anti-sigma factor